MNKNSTQLTDRRIEGDNELNVPGTSVWHLVRYLLTPTQAPTIDLNGIESYDSKAWYNKSRNNKL